MWFRQDLRLADHPALSAAAAAGEVIPLYVLDDETPGAWRWGGASRWWLNRSLAALGETAPLILRRGAADRVIGSLLRETGAQAVFFTRDYAPWSAELESRVKSACDENGADCRRFGGFLLHEPEQIRNGQDEPYRVYTPFSRACFAKGEPRSPLPVPKVVWWQGSVAGDGLKDWSLHPSRPDWSSGFAPLWQPGEMGALSRLKQFLDEGLADYAQDRDKPALSVTSRLSPHLHWGEISPHQVWHSVRGAMTKTGGRNDASAEKFLKEVLWREFSYHLLHHWPDLPTRPFRAEFNQFPWRDDPAALRAWQRGETGYPIVDAGMRELWATGIMHNRVRMIVASFLIKHLLISWTEGERWFWDTLVDADIGNNAASWQWVAGSGADAAPYFRIFNPVLQGQKFDPAGDYVTRWVPELKALPGDWIHRPWEARPDVLSTAGIALGSTYPWPIVDHGKARDRAMAAWRAIRSEDA
jgi:deoxyribodipyrimidine photo-lyase